jgi:hypothetical protein
VIQTSRRRRQGSLPLWSARASEYAFPSCKQRNLSSIFFSPFFYFEKRQPTVFSSFWLKVQLELVSKPHVFLFLFSFFSLLSRPSVRLWPQLPRAAALAAGHESADGAGRAACATASAGLGGQRFFLRLVGSRRPHLPRLNRFSVGASGVMLAVVTTVSNFRV